MLGGFVLLMLCNFKASFWSLRPKEKLADNYYLRE